MSKDFDPGLEEWMRRKAKGRTKRKNKLEKDPAKRRKPKSYQFDDPWANYWEISREDD